MSLSEPRPCRSGVHVQQGRIIAAQAYPQALRKGLSGEMPPIRAGAEAVSLLVGLQQGDFEFTPAPTSEIGVAPECDLNISGVLLETLRRRDEQR